MFKCQNCQKTTPPGMAENRVVLETRAKIYKAQHDKEGNVTDEGGVGEEIVREARICDSCLRKLSAELEERR